MRNDNRPGKGSWRKLRSFFYDLNREGSESNVIFSLFICLLLGLFLRSRLQQQHIISYDAFKYFSWIIILDFWKSLLLHEYSWWPIVQACTHIAHICYINLLITGYRWRCCLMFAAHTNSLIWINTFYMCSANSHSKIEANLLFNLAVSTILPFSHSFRQRRITHQMNFLSAINQKPFGIFVLHVAVRECECG